MMYPKHWRHSAPHTEQWPTGESVGVYGTAGKGGGGMKREVNAENLIAHLSKRRDEIAAENRRPRTEQEHIEAFIDMFGLGILSLTGDWAI